MSDWDERIVVKGGFKEQLCAVECTFGSIVRDDKQSCATIAVANSSVKLDAKAIATLQYMARKHAHARMNGFGEIPIGGEVHRLLPAVTAAIMLPLHVQSALALRLPTQWSGGALLEVFKGKGSHALILG